MYYNHKWAPELSNYKSICVVGSTILRVEFRSGHKLSVNKTWWNIYKKPVSYVAVILIVIYYIKYNDIVNMILLEFII